MVLYLFRKEIYLPFILSISLFLIIDYSSYNHIVLGKEDDSNDRDDKDNNVKEEEKEEDGKEEEDEVPFLLPFTAVPFP